MLTKELDAAPTELDVSNSYFYFYRHFAPNRVKFRLKLRRHEMFIE